MSRKIQSLFLWSKAGAGFPSRLLCALLGAFASLGHRKKFLRGAIEFGIGLFSWEGQIHFRWRLGKNYLVALRRGNQADYVVAGEFIKGAYSLPRNFSPGQIIDGGANIGLFSLFAWDAFPKAKIQCYEPDEENFKQLKLNLEANGIAAEAIPFGLWSRNATLYYHKLDSCTGHLDESPSGIPVQVVEPEVGESCWLKLDVEGAEYEVLPKLLEKGARPKEICMEAHFFDVRGNALLEILRKANYEICGDLRSYLDCTVITAFHHPALGKNS